MCARYVQHRRHFVSDPILGWHLFVGVLLCVSGVSWLGRDGIFAWSNKVQFDPDDNHAALHQWYPLRIDDLSDKVCETYIVFSMHCICLLFTWL